MPTYEEIQAKVKTLDIAMDYYRTIEIRYPTKGHIENFTDNMLTIAQMQVQETRDVSKLREVLRILNSTGHDCRMSLSPNFPQEITLKLAELKRDCCEIASGLLSQCETKDDPSSSSIDHLGNIKWGAKRLIERCDKAFKREFLGDESL